MRKHTGKAFLDKTSVIILLAILALLAASFAVGTTLAKYVIDVEIDPFTLKVYHRYEIYYGSIGTAEKTNPNPTGYSQISGEIVLQAAECVEGYTFAGWLLTSTIDTDTMNAAVISSGSDAIKSAFVEWLEINDDDATVTAHKKDGTSVQLSRDAEGKINLYALYKVSWEIGNTITSYYYSPWAYMADENGKYYHWNSTKTDVERDANGDPVVYDDEPTSDSVGVRTYYSANGGTYDTSKDPADVIATQYICAGTANDLLIIEGEGDVSMFAFNCIPRAGTVVTYATAPWSSYKTRTSRVVIPENATLGLTFMTGWFDGMSNLRSVYIGSGTDTSQVANIDCLFRNCSSLTTLEGFNYVSGKHIFQSRYAFQNCSSLQTIDMSGFIYPADGESNVSWTQGNTTYTLVHLNGMFDGCTNLETITKLEELDTTQFFNIGSTFRNCVKLTGELKLNMYNYTRVNNLPSISDTEKTRNYLYFLQNVTGVKLHYTSSVRISLVLDLMQGSGNPSSTCCTGSCGVTGCVGGAYTTMTRLYNGNYSVTINDEWLKENCGGAAYTNETVLQKLIDDATANNPYAESGYELHAFQILQGTKHDIGYSRISTGNASDPNSLEKIMANFADPAGKTSADDYIYVQPIYIVPES